MKTLGEEIKNIRDKHNNTLAQLADKTGVHSTYIAKIEKNLRKPSLETILKISKAYSLKIEELHKLLRLAGYDEKTLVKIENLYGNTESVSRKEVFRMEKIESEKQPVAVQVQVPNNLQVLYSDSAFITARPYGITFDFGQILGPTNQHNIVARIGLSLPHAKKFQKILSKKIIEAERLQNAEEQKESKDSTLGN